jgi:hypothetical protein
MKNNSSSSSRAAGVVPQRANKRPANATSHVLCLRAQVAVCLCRVAEGEKPETVFFVNNRQQTPSSLVSHFLFFISSPDNSATWRAFRRSRDPAFSCQPPEMPKART